MANVCNVHCMCISYWYMLCLWSNRDRDTRIPSVIPSISIVTSAAKQLKYEWMRNDASVYALVQIHCEIRLFRVLFYLRFSIYVCYLSHSLSLSLPLFLFVVYESRWPQHILVTTFSEHSYKLLEYTQF